MPRVPDRVVDWLLDPQTRGASAAQLVADLMAVLGGYGVRIARASTSIPTKHPEVFVRNVTWTPETGSVVETRPRDLLTTAYYLESPIRLIRAGARVIRCRLTGAGKDLSYPITRDLAEQGATDYVALGTQLGEGVRSFISFATDRPGGFTDEELALLEAIVPALELRFMPEASDFVNRSLLDVYLGPNAAARVLAGAFERGKGERIRAAIWYCDMRGFTALADRAPASDVVATLDRFFETLGEPIAARGGEILKFIGDAVLAIFVCGDDPEGACRRALDAAKDARIAVSALARLGAAAEPIEVGIALHLGEVMYGNIGARGRLDFTVIGRAVNEVCRVESLCKSLGESILLTADFAAALTAGEARSVGRHALRGVTEPAELFALLR